MKTGKKIAVALAAALAIAMFAGGAVSMVGAQFDGSVVYSAVVAGIDVNIGDDVVTEFPVAIPGGDPVVIAPSFTLTNAGPLDVKVEASSPGLFDELKKIPATCLSINGVQLAESETYIATVGVDSVEFDAALNVLPGQEPGSYTGTVELTFSRDATDTTDTTDISDISDTVITADTTDISDTVITADTADTSGIIVITDTTDRTAITAITEIP